MARYAIINTTTKLVENIVEYSQAPDNPPPGFTASYIAVVSDAASVGDSWNETAIVPKPVPAPTAQQLCDGVDAFRYQRLATGYADMAPGNTGKTWQCDPESIGNWTAIAANAQPWALGIAPQGSTAPTFSPWGTDNLPMALTATQAYALFAQRIMPWVTATYDYARQMKADIRAGNPPADITQGWP